CLHLGFFKSPREAARVLAVVRNRYPAAWVALAPADSMGSLDDTSAAQFKLIRTSRVPAPSVRPAPVATPKSAAPVSIPKPTAPAVPTLKATPVKATLVAPQSRRVPTPSAPVRPALSPKDVLQLLEQAPRALRKGPIRQIPPP